MTTQRFTEFDNMKSTITPREEGLRNKLAAQAATIERLAKQLQAIADIGHRATQSHDGDCTCAACLMAFKAGEGMAMAAKGASK